MCKDAGVSLVRAGREDARDAQVSIRGRNQEGPENRSDLIGWDWLTRQTTARKDARSPSRVRPTSHVKDEKDAGFIYNISKSSCDKDASLQRDTQFLFYFIGGEWWEMTCVLLRCGWKAQCTERWRRDEYVQRSRQGFLVRWFVIGHKPPVVTFVGTDFSFPTMNFTEGMSLKRCANPRWPHVQSNGWNMNRVVLSGAF